MRQKMIRWPRLRRLSLGTLILGLTMAFGQTALGRDADDLLCRREEVAQVVTREVRARDYYAEIDFSTVVELPTIELNVVYCTVGVISCPGHCVFWPRPAARQTQEYFVRVAKQRFTVMFGPSSPLTNSLWLDSVGHE